MKEDIEMLEIIAATDRELCEVEAIRYEMLKVVNKLPDDYDFDENMIGNTREYFLSGDQTTVLARIDEKTVACATICYITVMPTFEHQNGKRAHIMNVYTRPAYRHQGIAKMMMDRLIEEAHKRKITEISLDATEEGRPLYEKCGFVPSKEGMVLCL